MKYIDDNIYTLIKCRNKDSNGKKVKIGHECFEGDEPFAEFSVFEIEDKTKIHIVSRYNLKEYPKNVKETRNILKKNLKIVSFNISEIQNNDVFVKIFIKNDKHENIYEFNTVIIKESSSVEVDINKLLQNII